MISILRLCFISFLLAVFSVNTTEASTCYGCHGSSTPPDIRPVDAPFRDPGTGGVQGNHRTHMSVTTNAAVCDKCHTGASSFDTSHLFNSPYGFLNIKVSSNINNSPVAALYKNNTSAWPMTSTPILGTCTNVNCHFEKITPTWGNFSTMSYGGYSPPTTCATCHENPPSDGSHPKHANFYGGANSCSRCHANNTSFAHATSAGKRSLIVQFITSPNNGGSYSGDVSYPNYLPSQSQSRNGQCSNVYCHSDGKGNFKTPTWGNPSTGACGTCHQIPPMGNNAHAAHLTSAYGPLFGSDPTGIGNCSRCHVFTGYTNTTHIDGSLNVTTTVCNTCHPAITSFDVWNSGNRVTCESCHSGTLSVINGIVAPDKGKAATSGHGKPMSSAGNVLAITCQGCHDPDSAHLTTPVANNRLISSLTGSLNIECNYCHNDAGKVSSRFINMRTHFKSKMGAQEMECWQCHELHGTNNVSMIRAKIVYGSNSSLISYTNISSGMINRATNRGFCQVCHTMTKYYRAGIPELHHPSKNCYTCHPHNAEAGAFSPVDGNCDTCHGYPPVPASSILGPATAELQHRTFGTEGNYPNGWYENYSGGGGAHLLHCPPSEKASDGWNSSCAVCHDNGNSHIKLLPRDGDWRSTLYGIIGNVTVKVDPRYFFDSPITPYSDALLVNRPEKNQTGTCDACHMFERSGTWSNPRGFK